jgi:hypothetical protein
MIPTIEAKKGAPMPAPVSVAHPEAFISYASRDRARVLPIADQLQSAGVRAWLDRNRIDGGMVWAEEIVRGIKSCKAMLLMCSDAAMRSRAVKQEIQLAWKYELAYLPLLLEQTHFPEQLQFFLEGCQWIEVMEKPAEQWLPPVLRALARVGIESSRLASGHPAGGSGIQPTRPAPDLHGLRAVAKFTDRIWPLVVEQQTQPGLALYEVRDLGAAREGVEHRIRLGSRVFWALDWDQEAHLLLLDEGPEGKTYCLCPSWFAPDPHVRPGLTLLPQASAGCEPFVVTGVPGREHLLAILTDQPLGLEWMTPDTRVPARVLSQGDIDELLARLRRLESGSWTALATYCDVIV